MVLDMLVVEQVLGQEEVLELAVAAVVVEVAVVELELVTDTVQEQVVALVEALLVEKASAVDMA